MRSKKYLEIFLEGVPDFHDPSPALEQYITPAPIAADLIYTAYFSGHIDGKDVVDLGCGTGMLSAGAALLGGRVAGVDIDKNAVDLAENFFAERRLEAAFLCADVAEFGERCDTVVMNPPFGAQKKHADRKFIDKSCEIANFIYCICLKENERFVMNRYDENGFEVEKLEEHKLPLMRRFNFHTKARVDYSVSILRGCKHVGFSG